MFNQKRRKKKQPLSFLFFPSSFLPSFVFVLVGSCLGRVKERANLQVRLGLAHALVQAPVCQVIQDLLGRFQMRVGRDLDHAQNLICQQRVRLLGK